MISIDPESKLECPDCKRGAVKLVPLNDNHTGKKVKRVCNWCKKQKKRPGWKPFISGGFKSPSG